MNRSAPLLATFLIAGAACLGPEEAPPYDVEAGRANDEGCPEIFRQEVFPTYRVEIEEREWRALHDDFRLRADRIAAGQDPAPYHPIQLTFDDVEVPDAMIRLKGNSSWQQALDLDAEPKLQFVIAFNEIDEEGRFYGVRKVELDMPRTDATFLRQRLALSFLRDLGLPAQCANSARLFVNGEYYGLYAHVERLDKEFLQRHFPGPDEADGDLWKGGREIKTNEDTFSWARLDRFWSIEDDLAALEEIADLDASVREWAAEVIMPHADGYYLGRPNFYLYDHPTRGFVWLAHDLDSAFDLMPADTRPIDPPCAGVLANDRQHYRLVLGDPTWRERYVDHIAEALAAYDVDTMAGRLDSWTGQIHEAAADDPHKPFTTDTHLWAIEAMRAYLSMRTAYLEDWLACRAERGDDPSCD